MPILPVSPCVCVEHKIKMVMAPPTMILLRGSKNIHRRVQLLLDLVSVPSFDNQALQWPGKSKFADKEVKESRFPSKVLWTPCKTKNNRLYQTGSQEDEISEIQKGGHT